MRKIENECLGCQDIGLYCIGDTCKYRNVIRFYCDKCKEEETLYHYDGMELCADCLLKMFEIVEGSEIV